MLKLANLCQQVLLERALQSDYTGYEVYLVADHHDAYAYAEFAKCDGIGNAVKCSVYVDEEHEHALELWFVSSEEWTDDTVRQFETWLTSYVGAL